MVVIIIGIQIIGYAVAVGIVVHRVAVLRIVVGQSNVFVDGVNAVAIVIHIQVIGRAVAIGILGIVGIPVTAGVGIFVGRQDMVAVIIFIKKIIMPIVIRIQDSIIYGAAIG